MSDPRDPLTPDGEQNHTDQDHQDHDDDLEEVSAPGFSAPKHPAALDEDDIDLPEDDEEYAPDPGDDFHQHGQEFDEEGTSQEFDEDKISQEFDEGDTRQEFDEGQESQQFYENQDPSQYPEQDQQFDPQDYPHEETIEEIIEDFRTHKLTIGGVIAQNFPRIAAVVGIIGIAASLSLLREPPEDPLDTLEGQLHTVMSNMTTKMLGEFGYGTDELTKPAIAAGVFPPELIDNTGIPRNLYGGILAVRGNNESFMVLADKIPNDRCVEILTKGLYINQWIREVVVGGAAYSRGRTSEKNAKESCAKSGGVMVWKIR